MRTPEIAKGYNTTSSRLGIGRISKLCWAVSIKLADPGISQQEDATSCLSRELRPLDVTATQHFATTPPQLRSRRFRAFHAIYTRVSATSRHATSQSRVQSDRFDFIKSQSGETQTLPVPVPERCRRRLGPFGSRGTGGTKEEKGKESDWPCDADPSRTPEQHGFP